MGDMTEPATIGIPTSRIRVGMTFPPCPTCGAEVTNVLDENAVEDRRLCFVEVTVYQGREPIELVPCGHHVQSYAHNLTRVTRWVAL